MLINYWDCDYANADEIECGTDDDPDWMWYYGCTHPNNEKSVCLCDNQWYDNEDDCKFLDFPDTRDMKQM